MNMERLILVGKVDSFLNDLDRVEPLSFDLGTPELPEVDAVHELVNMGTEIVPLLLERIQQNGSKKRIAYSVLVLKHIGAVQALAPLLDLRTRYQQLETKNEWDYVVIGQCNLAIAHLEKNAR
jgi:hypothetical protein